MKKIFLLLFFLLNSHNLWAINPITPVFNYFANLLDETKAEILIGDLMTKTFIEDVSKHFEITLSESLTKRMKELASNTPRKKIKFQVYVINSDIPDEIPMPGGTLILTKGLLNHANTTEKQNFVLARNVIHIAKKNPMKLIKRLGIYPVLLNQLKLNIAKRNNGKILMAIRDYLGGLGKLEHIIADKEALYLTSDPEKTRLAAITLLGQFSIGIWPMAPIEAIDMPERISQLKKLQIIRQ